MASTRRLLKVDEPFDPDEPSLALSEEAREALDGFLSQFGEYDPTWEGEEYDSDPLGTVERGPDMRGREKWGEKVFEGLVMGGGTRYEPGCIEIIELSPLY